MDEPGRNPITRRRFLQYSGTAAGLVVAGGLIGAACGNDNKASATPTASGGGTAPTAGGGASTAIRTEEKVLSMVGFAHFSDTWYKPFHQQTGITVDWKANPSDVESRTAVKQAPGTYDGTFLDAGTIAVWNQDGLSGEPFDPNDFPFEDYPEQFVPKKGTLAEIALLGDKLMAVPTHAGFNGILYNTKSVTDQEAQDYNVLFDPKFKGKIVMWDAVLYQMMAVSLAVGNSPPHDLNQQQFDNLVAGLRRLQDQDVVFLPSFPEAVQAFTTGRVVLGPGIGTWGSIPLADQGLPVKVSFPKQGLLIYLLSFINVKGAKHPGNVRQLAQFFAGPTGHYFSETPGLPNTPINKKAWALLPANLQQGMPAVPAGPNLETLYKDVGGFVLQYPKQQSLDEWVGVWTKFKAHSL